MSTTSRTQLPPHLLRVADLDAVSLAEVLDLSEEMKGDPLGWRDVPELGRPGFDAMGEQREVR
jgi:hypothetical protein